MRRAKQSDTHLTYPTLLNLRKKICPFGQHKRSQGSEPDNLVTPWGYYPCYSGERNQKLTLVVVPPLRFYKDRPLKRHYKYPFMDLRKGCGLESPRGKPDTIPLRV